MKTEKPFWDGDHIFDGDGITVRKGLYEYYRGGFVVVLHNDVRDSPYQKSGPAYHQCNHVGVVYQHWTPDDTGVLVFATNDQFTGQAYDFEKGAYVRLYKFRGSQWSYDTSRPGDLPKPWVEGE